MKFSQVHNLPEMKDYRRELRNKPTFAEKILWDELKGKKLKGYKFRRQHSIANYIVDFYCPEYLLAIELDGEHHYDKYEKMYDDERTAFLNELKIKVIRFDNNEVVDNMSTVLIKIVEAINT